MNWFVFEHFKFVMKLHKQQRSSQEKPMTLTTLLRAEDKLKFLCNQDTQAK